MRFSYPEAMQRELTSMRTLNFDPRAGKVTLSSVDRYLDASCNETGGVRRSVVELTGSWEGARFRSTRQRVISTDYSNWAQEEIIMFYSPRGDHIDMISSYVFTGNFVFGKEVLTPLGE